MADPPSSAEASASAPYFACATAVPPGTSWTAALASDSWVAEALASIAALPGPGPAVLRACCPPAVRDRVVEAFLTV